jgi:hypothetical protein
VSPAAARTGAVGDTARYRIKVTAIAYAPDRATYETSAPGYVTIISVTERAIEALVPLATEDPHVEMAGTRTTGLSRGREGIAMIPSQVLAAEQARVAEIQDYNRCLERARAYDKARAEQNRRVVGRDSAGRPIYGPPEFHAADRSAESSCVLQQPAPEQPQARSTPGIRGNRHLLLFLSDTPVAHRQILELSVSEADPRIMAAAIGRKLFADRGATWSGYYQPW